MHVTIGESNRKLSRSTVMLADSLPSLRWPVYPSPARSLKTSTANKATGSRGAETDAVLVTAPTIISWRKP